MIGRFRCKQRPESDFQAASGIFAVCSFLRTRMLKQKFLSESCTQTCNFFCFPHGLQRAIRAGSGIREHPEPDRSGEKGGNRTAHEGGSMTGTPRDRMRSGTLTISYASAQCCPERPQSVGQCVSACKDFSAALPGVFVMHGRRWLSPWPFIKNRAPTVFSQRPQLVKKVSASRMRLKNGDFYRKSPSPPSS